MSKSKLLEENADLFVFGRGLMIFSDLEMPRRWLIFVLVGC